MEAAIAGVLGVAADRVNVKITSTDRLGFIGREEGIAALAVALIEETEERG
jgi:2C-methyl-D-erythritol 2,4-cyclodiphosphate synthase